MKNLKNLRPVQQKEIKDLLSDEEKLETKVTLFKGQQAATHTEGFSPVKQQPKLTEEDIEEKEDFEGREENVESDLNLLVPENFNEIPYIS